MELVEVLNGFKERPKHIGVYVSIEVQEYLVILEFFIGHIYGKI